MSLIYYSEEEDNNKEESINKYKDFFLDYKNKSPTLSEALNQMFQSANLDEAKCNKLTNNIFNKCKEVIDNNYVRIKEKYNNISKYEAYIISNYTCELKEKKFSPYRLLNTNLVCDNRKKGIKNISKYLYIFLKALRNLTRYYPKAPNKYLYRCITNKVNIAKDPFNDKLVPYIIGNRKTFWGFTSTSSNPKGTYNFLKEEEKIKVGTLFIFGGDIWGYDITLFNYFGEEEILLEPEKKFIIDNVLPPLNGVINVTCTLLETPLKLDNDKEQNIPNDIYISKEKTINKREIIFDKEFSEERGHLMHVL